MSRPADKGAGRSCTPHSHTQNALRVGGWFSPSLLAAGWGGRSGIEDGRVVDRANPKRNELIAFWIGALVVWPATVLTALRDAGVEALAGAATFGTNRRQRLLLLLMMPYLASFQLAEAAAFATNMRQMLLLPLYCPTWLPSSSPGGVAGLSRSNWRGWAVDGPARGRVLRGVEGFEPVDLTVVLVVADDCVEVGDPDEDLRKKWRYIC